jgi:hypothetical protein
MDPRRLSVLGCYEVGCKAKVIFSSNRGTLRLKPLLLVLHIALFASGCATAPPPLSKPNTATQQSYVLRDASGRIKRSEAAKNAFKREHPCPATSRPVGPCPGYVIDHIIALKRGGADAPSNMQWQTIEDGKAKDRVE